ncbi:MAG TPA: NUDIX domain-containing protein [Ohtaekwangia sp.]|nr:NUDIX domain-containing protein [Ohtaekwangia sp.]
MMIIFINDIPVRILKETESPGEGRVNQMVDTALEPLTQAKLIHHVWIKNAGEKEIDILLACLDSHVPTNVISVFISVLDYANSKSFLLNKFKVIKAAGGLVRKKEKSLMIYRMKKWDLPKGKKEKGEKYKETALREVEEECNVNVKLGKKICTTWHTYTMNKRAMIKKTRWYAMDLIDDSRMRPQTDEDIEETRWMNRKEVYHALEHSYKSISYVFERFYALTEPKTARN